MTILSWMPTSFECLFLSRMVLQRNLCTEVRTYGLVSPGNKPTKMNRTTAGTGTSVGCRHIIDVNQKKRQKEDTQ